MEFKYLGSLVRTDGNTLPDALARASVASIHRGSLRLMDPEPQSEDLQGSSLTGCCVGSRMLASLHQTWADVTTSWRCRCCNVSSVHWYIAILKELTKIIWEAAPQLLNCPEKTWNNYHTQKKQWNTGTWFLPVIISDKRACGLISWLKDYDSHCCWIGLITLLKVFSPLYALCTVCDQKCHYIVL